LIKSRENLGLHRVRDTFFRDSSEGSRRSKDVRDSDVKDTLSRESDVRERLSKDSDIRDSDVKETLSRDSDVRDKLIRDSDVSDKLSRDSDLKSSDVRDTLTRDVSINLSRDSDISVILSENIVGRSEDRISPTVANARQVNLTGLRRLSFERLISGRLTEDKITVGRVKAQPRHLDTG
jgi:hypothetical protein